MVFSEKPLRRTKSPASPVQTNAYRYHTENLFFRVIIILMIFLSVEPITQRGNKEAQNSKRGQIILAKALCFLGIHGQVAELLTG
jgi:hypothetical protein